MNELRYYSTIKRNELSHEKIRRKLKCILLRENKTKQNTKWKTLHIVIPTVWHSGRGKTMENIKKISGCQGLKEKR